MKKLIGKMKDICWPLTWLKILYGAIFISFAIAAVLAAVQGNWDSFFLSLAAIALFLVPFLIGKQFKIYIPTIFSLLISAFLYATLILGEIEQYYQKYWWWDSMLHAGSAMAFGIIGLIVILIFFRLGKLTAPPFVVCLFAFCFAIAVGVVWEIYEFAGDMLVGTNMQQTQTGVIDTMKDLIVDTIGAFIGAVLSYFYLSPNIKTPLDPVIHKTIRKNQ